MDFDFTKLLVSVGGLAGVTGLIEIVANGVQILDWIKNKFEKKDKTGSNANKLVEIPHNLPSSGKLVGRRSDVKKLCTAIDKNVVTMVIGRGGIGKSSLALETVKRYYLSKSRKHFRFDAIVWISAKNEEITFPVFLDTIARVMEYTGILQITELDTKAIEIKQLFQKNKILLIVDNFETIIDENIAKFIENVCDNDRVIITTRENRVWDISAVSIFVEKLDDKEGRALVKHEYEKRGLDFKGVSNEVLQDLLSATDGSPLAIKWVVGKIATTRLPIDRIVKSLQTGKGDVFEKMFSSSWSVLSVVCQEILYKLLFFTPAASREALWHVTGLDEYTFDTSIGRLYELSLIEVNGDNANNQSYSFHPLTRSFVEKMKDDACVDDISFFEPVVDYYVCFCEECGEKGTRDSFDKLENELCNIYKVVNWASPYQSYTERIISIISNISVFLWSRGYWTKRVEYSNLVFDKAIELGLIKQAIIHKYYLGIVKFWQGDVQAACCAAEKCVELNKRVDDVICSALILRLEALIHMGENSTLSIQKFTQVLKILENANALDVKLFADWRVDSEFGYKAGIVSIYQELGIALNRNSSYDEAIVWLDKSLVLAKEIDDIEGQAVSLSHLGFSYIGLCNYGRAKALCEEGLHLAVSINRKSTIGRCYQVLAISEAMYNHRRKSAKYAQSAFEMFERLGMEKELEEVKKYL